jgi:hypothetical protein
MLKNLGMTAVKIIANKVEKWKSGKVKKQSSISRRPTFSLFHPFTLSL